MPAVSARKASSARCSSVSSGRAFGIDSATRTAFRLIVLSPDWFWFIIIMELLYLTFGNLEQREKTLNPVSESKPTKTFNRTLFGIVWLNENCNSSQHV